MIWFNDSVSKKSSQLGVPSEGREGDAVAGVGMLPAGPGLAAPVVAVRCSIRSLQS